MNPDEQADLEAVFGKDALEAIAKNQSDRRAEGWARRKGSTLPDMRRGKNPRNSKFDALPLDPRDLNFPRSSGLPGGADARGSRCWPHRTGVRGRSTLRPGV